MDPHCSTFCYIWAVVLKTATFHISSLGASKSCSFEPMLLPVVTVATAATRSAELPNFCSERAAGLPSVPALRSLTELVYTSD